MTDNYPEQLAERLRARHSSGRSLNKASFLAVKDDVIAALDAGFVSKDIWSDLRNCNRIDFSYDTFLRLVKLYISLPVAETSATVRRRKSTVKSGAPSSPVATSSQLAKPASGSADFVFNPRPNEDELF